ncbi:hypothetical protein EYF80_041572 [Liparis tanakae]|uniref:Uncharacterized protein n=1 Tax=Liparis tanakae TaxID=230148 RepID=A0A4Z2G5S2_9TELE|nr:hypothetical protein EYF80_041572 [Liparis tanakae]
MLSLMSVASYDAQIHYAVEADCEDDADSSWSFTQSSFIRVEYYRSFEYSVKWKLAMFPRRSSRPPKAAKRSPSPSEEAIQRRSRGKRRRTGPRETEEDDHDILDLINGTPVADEEEAEDKFFEVTDGGVDESDDDCCSVSSIASGPSVLRHGVSTEKRRPSQGLCAACRALYQKTRKTKAPRINKLSDNDPKSLTCDQWVLIKSWRPRRRPNARGKLLIRLQLVQKRLSAKAGAQRAGGSSACFRPHAFLQRNLRRHVREPVTKERKRKRTRTRGGSRGRRRSASSTSSPGLEARGDRADTHLTLKLFPSTVAVESTEPIEVPREQKAPKKTGGLRDLLAQLRGSSSMIVRETR